MKRLVGLLLVFLYTFSAHAVLKEHDLEQTISVLRSELEYYKQKQEEWVKSYQLISKHQHDNIVSTIEQSEQVALMLYSQKQDYTFDLAYACHEATALYEDFSRHQVPYQKILDNYRVEIERYSQIIQVLKRMPPHKGDSLEATSDSIHWNHTLVRMNDQGLMDTISTDTIPTAKLLALTMDSLHHNGLPFSLSEQGQNDRDSCISLATSIRTSYITLFNSISEDSEHYEQLSDQLKQLNDYAIKRYADIKQLIFRNGGKSYFSILASLPFYLKMAQSDISEKYMLPQNYRVDSEWRGPIVVGFSFFIIFYLVVSYILCRLIIRFLVPDKFKKESFQEKETYYILASSVLTFSIVLFVMRCFMYHNFFLMASKLLIEYACLLGAVLFSLLIRVKGDQITSCIKIYVPILVMGFIIIVFRIIFISNTLVNILFPPILLVFTVWQWIVVHRHNKNIPFSDIAYTYVSLVVITVSCIASWVGYTLLSVQIFIWWLFQLTAIQAITCLRDLILRNEYQYVFARMRKKQDQLPEEERLPDDKFEDAVNRVLHPSKKTMGNHLRTTWMFDLLKMTIIPVASLASILICLYMAAGIFDLTETCKIVFKENFINVEGVCQLSLQKMVAVAVLFFVFKFINYAAKATYRYYRIKHSKSEEANITLANNIISILTWGSDFIIILVLLHIPKSGISIVTAGLATGVGFAMKDILENFFYGMSLMTGRIRVGDYIECDGIRGKVESITYQSTQITTLDGCIMAFLNSSLFNKNFKNLTKNHGYELVKLEIGVGYNTNIEHARSVILNALDPLKEQISSNGNDLALQKDKELKVIVGNLGESSVDLIAVMWIHVEDKFYVTGKAKEMIYNALNEASIEIPFPQRTVYIKQ